MFFISWGSRGKHAEVGPAGLMHCAYCDKDSYFTRMVAYTVRHLYWIFRWVTDRTPYVLCGNCGAAHTDDADAHSPGVRKAIPMWDRRGWLAGLGGIGAIIATGSLAVAANNVADKNYVGAPHVGDIYEADLAKLLVKPEAPVMYSVMRVTHVDAKGVEVEMAKLYYDDWRGVDRDLDTGKAGAPDYFAPDRVTFKPASIQKMYDEGVLHDVRR